MSLFRLRSNKVLSSTNISLLASGMLFVLSTGLTQAIAAERLQLKTADREVRGTREIESGNYAVGIEKLETALSQTATRQDRAPILINLCVAYVATRDLDRADSYCQMAVDNGYNLDLAYNNRGVMNYTAGNIEAGILDFDLASKLAHGYGVAPKNLALVTD